MKLPSNWRELLSKNLYTVLAVVFIAVLLLGYLIFFTTSIAPALRTRSDTAAELNTARQQLAQAQNTQSETPASLEQKLVAAQNALTESLKVFLPDYQASQIVDMVYQRATEGGVAIVDFQTQVTPAQGAKPLYTLTEARLNVQGTSYNLLRYLATLNITAIKSIILNSVTITRSETFSNMGLDLTLYTSPYAPLQTLPIVDVSLPPVITPVPLITLSPTPGPAPSPTSPPATSVDQLAQQLDSFWTAQNWPEAIRVIEQLRALDPTYDDLTTKLYAAHVNYGYQLQSQGNLDAAREAFRRALIIKPDGAEAATALRDLETVPTPRGPFVYTVQAGDTLFTIADRYGVPLPTLMQANGLTGFGLVVGQQLIIP
jgi:tetratricopeptide (TPR) repeat protein